LRQLQDTYSEELDLDSSDTSSQGSIEPGKPEETDFEEGRGEKYKMREENLEPSRNKAGQNRDLQAGMESRMMRAHSQQRRGTHAHFRG
jgi:hypothetical protein